MNYEGSAWRRGANKGQNSSCHAGTDATTRRRGFAVRPEGAISAPHPALQERISRENPRQSNHLLCVIYLTYRVTDEVLGAGRQFNPVLRISHPRPGYASFQLPAQAHYGCDTLSVEDSPFVVQIRIVGRSHRLFAPFVRFHLGYIGFTGSKARGDATIHWRNGQCRSAEG